MSTLLVRLIWPSSANAQVHWDVGLAAGAVERVTTGADPGAPVPTPGPVAELHAHVAIVPMIRAGPYVIYDVSPVNGRPARQMLEGGLRLKLTPPWVRSPWHVWTFVGFGYAGAYAPGYAAETSSSTAPSSIYRMPGTGGGIVEMPLGIGASVKLRGPWALFAELGGRIGWLFSGSMYERPGCLCESGYVGKDSFAAALTVGVSLEQ